MLLGASKARAGVSGVCMCPIEGHLEIVSSAQMHKAQYFELSAAKLTESSERFMRIKSANTCPLRKKGN